MITTRTFTLPANGFTLCIVDNVAARVPCLVQQAPPKPLCSTVVYTITARPDDWPWIEKQIALAI